jgi:osmotically-inducible protein OsmY
LARQIRRDVVKDKSLSTYGRNVKIIAQGGKVTLRGPVHTADEKRAIVDLAGKRAGDGNVVDQLTVKDESK